METMRTLWRRRLGTAVLVSALTLLVALGSEWTHPSQAAQEVTSSSAVDLPPTTPFLMVLGVAQDAGIPQAGSHQHPAWRDPSQRRMATSLGLVDPATDSHWLFEATPDFRQQYFTLHTAALDARLQTKDPPQNELPLSGIFLTHAHIGHYAGLMFLGHESMGARDIAVHAMPNMLQYLKTNGPWDQLVRYGNIRLQAIDKNEPVALNQRLQVTALLVPHRQEYSEVVGYRIQGPQRSVLFIPDIDSWHELDELGVAIEDWIAAVDIAYLDGTFFANGEIPGRDMSGFPHPFISHSMQRFSTLPAAEKAKVHFIHFNHTNSAARPGSPEQASIEAAGFNVAREGDRIGL